MKPKKTSKDKLLDITFEEVYKFGYSGASTASILKKAGVPKGSMYHHFKSKKEMVLVMIEQRLIPKVRNFFDFGLRNGLSAINILEETLEKISANKILVAYGCPLHRLIFEMGALDNDIALACSDEFKYLSLQLSEVLALGMKEGSIKQSDNKALADFVITSTWGFLSHPIQSSSKAQFTQDSTFLLNSIRT